MKSRSLLIDLLKGVAIIAVILYHSGIFQYGYLGVEIFLVVGGYLISKSILRSSENEKFSYWTYFCRRLVRLWPLLILISLVSLAIGSITMLPEHLKNLSETVVGTSSFSNNFVQYITSGNYWDQGNDFKPLMHTWYIGLMF
jgi:peptidoglycan/LPS O-acetylase OafA/YrhL